MAALPPTAKSAWENREGPVILTTVDADGTPNSIYATCVSMFGDERLIVADNYFDKTRRNVQGGGKAAAILFMAKGGKAYQVKGMIEYHTEGDVFADMKAWNPSQHPGHAAAALVVQEVYSGAERLL